MKVAKFGHSCLYIVNPDRTALIDPGVYSDINFDIVKGVDRLIVTHNHPDHLGIENIKNVIEKFPDVHVVCGEEVKRTMIEEGLPKDVIYRPTTVCSAMFKAPHPSLPWADTVAENFGVHFQNELTHPGDSLEFDTTARVLALPINAPWTSNKAAVEHVLNLDDKPEVVIPIHDWHLNTEAREDIFGKANSVFEKVGIKFMPLSSDELTEV